MTDKRLKILDAVVVLIAKQGVQSLSFENIAHEAQLSRQLVRYYFADLDAVMKDVCNHLAVGYRDSLVRGIVKVQQPHRLDFFLDFFFGLAEAEGMPKNLEAYDALFGYAAGSETLREALCTHYELLGHVMDHELAIAYPTLDSAACKELSFLFVSQMHAHWSFVSTLRYSSAHNRIARQAFARLIASYVAEFTNPGTGADTWSKEK